MASRLRREHVHQLQNWSEPAYGPEIEKYENIFFLILYQFHWKSLSLNLMNVNVMIGDYHSLNFVLIHTLSSSPPKSKMHCRFWWTINLKKSLNNHLVNVTFYHPNWNLMNGISVTWVHDLYFLQHWFAMTMLVGSITIFKPLSTVLPKPVDRSRQFQE